MSVDAFDRRTYVIYEIEVQFLEMQLPSRLWIKHYSMTLEFIMNRRAYFIKQEMKSIYQYV